MAPELAPGDGPVFVVGMNGSGTTMLADSLGRHPALYVFPFESKLMPAYARRVAARGGLTDLAAAAQLAEEIGRSKPFWHANGKRPLVVPAQQIRQPSVAAVFDALFLHMAARQGKHRWGEKSPANSEHVALLAQMYPQARFVHIIRDGRDAAQSFHRRWGFDAEHTIWRWKRTVALACAQGASLGPERYMEVHYETLTAEPERDMKKICAFLGLPFDAQVLGSSMRHMKATDKAQASARIVANSGQWRDYFSPAQQTRLEALAGARLQALGYPAALAGDDDLSAARLRWLRWKDRFNRSLAFFRDYGWRGLPMFLRVLKAAREQAKVRKF